MKPRFNVLSIQQKCHRALLVCAVGSDPINVQSIQHYFSRMSEGILISRGYDRKLWTDSRQQRRRS